MSRYPQNRTITLPAASTVTVYRLGLLYPNAVVDVSDSAGAYKLNTDSLNTNTSGQASVSIPTGLNCRFAVYEGGLTTLSAQITAPANLSMIAIVPNNPSLTAPANDYTCAASETVAFSWGSTTSATYYGSYYNVRPGWTYLGATTGNTANLSGFPVGAFQWRIRALNSSGATIAMSEIRTIMFEESLMEEQSLIEEEEGVNEGDDEEAASQRKSLTEIKGGAVRPSVVPVIISDDLTTSPTLDSAVAEEPLKQKTLPVTNEEGAGSAQEVPVMSE